MCHSFDGFGQQYFIGTSHRDGLMGQLSIDQARPEDANNIFNGSRAYWFVFQTHQREHGERIKSVAQVIQHVIANPIDHAAFQYRVVQPRGANDLFSSPLRLMIAGAATRSRTQKTPQCDFLHPRASRRVHDTTCSFDMDLLISLLPNLTIDSGAMRDRIASAKGFDQLRLVLKTYHG